MPHLHKKYTKSRMCQSEANLAKAISTRIKLSTKFLDLSGNGLPIEERPKEVETRHFFRQDQEDRGKKYAEDFLRLQSSLVESIKRTKRIAAKLKKSVDTFRFPLQRKKIQATLKVSAGVPINNSI